MYRILVVEDEPPIARYLCRLLEHFSEDFLVAAVGENGQEGVTLYEQHRPELVITDVRMPRMNGLEMFGKIKEINPKVKGIIISDYRDFEYARDGLRLGVENYLIKPVTEEQLRENLRQIYEVLEKERGAVRQEGFKRLLFGELEGTRLLEMGEAERYRLVLFQKGCVLNPRMKYLIQPKEEEKLDPGELEQWLGSRNVVAWANGTEENLLAVLWGAAEAPGFRAGKEPAQQFGTAVCSEPFQNLNRVKDYYKECRKILYYHTVIGESQVLWQNAAGVEEKTFHYFKDREEILKQAVARGNFELLKNELVSCFDRLEQQEAPQYQVERVLQRIFSAAEERRCISYEQQQNSVAEILFFSRNMSEVLGGLLELLSTGWKFQEQDDTGKGRGRQALENMEAYIESHREEIFSLQDISEIFGFSQTYICRLFHNYRKISFKDYVTDLKIQKARELLQQGMNIKDIAEHLGYQDQFYFSKVFKKKTGESPSAYKKKRWTNEI